jgi:hypothetical protein
MKIKLHGAFLAILAAAAPAIRAQVVERNGLYLTSVSTGVTYFAQGVPPGIIPPGDVFLGSSWGAESGVGLGWREIGPKASFEVQSSSSYGNRFGQPAVHAWNEEASIRFTRQLGRKWSLRFGGAGNIMNFDQSLFSPSTLSQTASTPATYDDLASAVLTGQSSNPQLVNAAFKPDLSSAQFLFGRRTATGGLQGSLSYAHSPRLTISASGGYMTIRHLVDSTDPVGLIFPKSSSTVGGVDVNYALSPRTQIGGGVSLTQTSGSVDKTQSVSSTISISRTMSRRWFCQFRVGGTNSTSGTQRSHQTALYSAGIGAKTYSHTFLFSYDHSIGDPFLVSLGTPWSVDTYGAAWNWTKPSSPWVASGDFSHVHAITNGLATTNTWHVTMKMSRRLTRSTLVAWEFTVGRVGARRYVIDGVTYQLRQTAGRISFVWDPVKRLL